ncbi:MAG: TM2 domain-containing protein [Candidatus Cloacimonadaceae bacterium]|jgi:TM2 domain-containing membrane protein YozV|nr:NINE protein [Candidatus Cloacimonadota bacterium]MDX9950280.1 TM2 domain-containing protein [Candidatus Syntrophosphaera sp.]NLN85431.1 TM2 domain-containing protein [Candidatus Cloacimonadota bacterium]
MHCTNCGKEVDPKAVICPSCGVQINQNAPIVEGEGKDWLTALLLCLFIGPLGIHRFYTGHTVIGIIQILTVGGCGIWTLIDLIQIITGSFRDANGNPLVKKN